MAISAEASAHFEKQDLSQPLTFFLIFFFPIDSPFDTAIAAPLKGARPDLRRKRQPAAPSVVCGMRSSVCGLWLGL